MQHWDSAVPPLLRSAAVASVPLGLFKISMSPDSENFEQLRHLLAVKRHEQPPPGYYHSFSREVIVRIKAGELGEEQTTVWWSWEGSWLQRVWAAFETRPVVPGAVGLVVCGFFVGGVLISENVQDSGGLAIAQPAAI